MSASSAIALYELAGSASVADCEHVDMRWRTPLQTPRLPISSKVPPSPSDANDAAMKSSERLLNTACDRPADRSRVTPTAKAAPSRELHVSRTPAELTTACLCARPAVPKACARSQ